MDKYKRRTRRKRGIRKHIGGTKAKPRVSVYRSNRHIFVQAIDDESGITLCSASDVEAGVKSNTEGAHPVGEQLAEKLKKVKVQEAVRGLISGSLVWGNQGIMRLHGSVPRYGHPNGRELRRQHT